MYIYTYTRTHTHAFATLVRATNCVGSLKHLFTNCRWLTRDPTWCLGGTVGQRGLRVPTTPAGGAVSFRFLCYRLVEGSVAAAAMRLL